MIKERVVFVAIKEHRIVCSVSMSGLSLDTGISVSSLKRDLSDWVEIKGWDVICVGLIGFRARGKSGSF